MEADGLKLSDEEVRERFSAYHEGELPPPEIAFIKKRLAEDPALAAEYERFRKVLSKLASMGLDTAEGTKLPAAPGERESEPRVDLLTGVQERLNKRSGGKFYRTRWSRRAGLMPIEAIAAVVLVVLLLVYIAMTYVTGMQSAGSRSSQTPQRIQDR